MTRSCVVTGGGGGIGRAIADRLLAGGDVVVVLDRDDAALGWTSAHPAGRRVIAVAGDAADEAVTEQAADLAQDAGRLAGWVNNAAVFRDAWLDAVPAREVTQPQPRGDRVRDCDPPVPGRRGRRGRSSTSPRTRRSGRLAGPCPMRRPRPRSRA